MILMADCEVPGRPITMHARTCILSHQACDHAEKVYLKTSFLSSAFSAWQWGR